MLKARTLLLALLALPLPAFGQEELPTGLATMEARRSRTCVGTMARMDSLEVQLQPLAARSDRLLAVRQAIQLEERDVVDSLRADDPTEAAVRAWFDSDLALAQRYVDTGDEAVATQRSAAREAILSMVTDTLMAVRVRAQGHIEASGDLPAASAQCEGAIFVRPVALQACDGVTSTLCTAARSSQPSQRYRFVASADDLWGVSEFRPWTDPGPLRVAADGQIAGARTVGYARQGNVVLTLSFSPLLQRRDAMQPEQLARVDAIVDSLEFDFSHPDIAFVPALGLGSNLPQPLAGETTYVLHFGPPEEAVALWTGPAGTGAPIEVTVAMGPTYLVALASGAPITFTALAPPSEDGSRDTVFSVEFTPVGQTRAVNALVGYMSGQLSEDLAELVPAGGG